MGLFINTLPVRIGIGREGVESECGDADAAGGPVRHEHAVAGAGAALQRVPAPAPLFSRC